MPLEDLVEHAPAQIEAINSFFETRPPKDSCPLLNTCGADVWGMGLETLQNEEPVERDSDPVDDILAFPDSIPSTRLVVTPPEVQSKLWRLSEPRILARPEYYEAEQAAMAANEVGADVFMIAGHPGIGSSPTLTLTPTESNALLGKSVFLLWLLVRRLALGLPTVLQTHKDRAILFNQGKVFQLDDLNDPEAYTSLEFPHTCHHKRIWVIVDTKLSLPEPAGIFRFPGTFFVVNATFRSHFCEWSDEVDTRWFYMKPWSFSEIIQAYVDPASRNSRNSHPTGAHSSGPRTTAQNGNSGTCTTRSEHPPETWLSMRPNRLPTNVLSSIKSTK